MVGEYIIRKDEVGEEMYFISKVPFPIESKLTVKGAAEVCSGDGKTIFKVLNDGDFFGELALLSAQKRSASVRTVGHVDLFVLSR